MILALVMEQQKYSFSINIGKKLRHSLDLAEAVISLIIKGRLKQQKIK